MLVFCFLMLFYLIFISTCQYLNLYGEWLILHASFITQWLILGVQSIYIVWRSFSIGGFCPIYRGGSAKISTQTPPLVPFNDEKGGVILVY